MQYGSAFSRLCEVARANIEELTIVEVKQSLDAGQLPLLIDVREDHEWQKGHLPQAEHVARGIIERDIESHVPDKNTRLIVYCGGGSRSILAAENLQKMGYLNVMSMAGGWRAWNEAGYPVVQ